VEEGDGLLLILEDGVALGVLEGEGELLILLEGVALGVADGVDDGDGELLGVELGVALGELDGDGLLDTEEDGDALGDPDSISSGPISQLVPALVVPSMSVVGTVASEAGPIPLSSQLPPVNKVKSPLVGSLNSLSQSPPLGA
jgi:hypothetical protein